MLKISPIHKFQYKNSMTLQTFSKGSLILKVEKLEFFLKTATTVSHTLSNCYWLKKKKENSKNMQSSYIFS